ncbi:hypothetical protein BDN70DRAFT_21478 [Pholiota conissans]|uniref:Fork-head domain-containing protein n=1 Tax=Pholiota conissans TaxID=109636 RepID=A0A9P5ZG93_9AGAR|nr:hypothetical protein BDN70DRAFT_21478 [Pholiota conissans]
MSHLHEILNHNPQRPHDSKLSDPAAVPVVDQLDLSSSAEEDIDISPFEDDEIDELDDESDDDIDSYDEAPPSSATPPGTSTEQQHSADIQLPPPEEITDGPKPLPKTDVYPVSKDEKRAEPAPRRKHEKHDRKIDLGLHDHKAHADCPDTLACLPDTHGRPQHTLPVILRCAILGSPRKRLTIREIYATMESKYPYYKTAGQTWKQSVRHHLSLNRLFERQPRPVTDPGFGSYWTVNLSAPPGTKRPRKRGRPNKDGLEGTVGKKGSLKSFSQSQIQLDPQPVKYQFQPQSHPPPPPPPLPQPQVNTLTPRGSNHHHSILPMPPRRSSHSPQYHSPPESQSLQLQPAPKLISLQTIPPPPQPPQPSVQHHQHHHQQQHNYSHPNQKHRQSNAYPPAHISLPSHELTHSSSSSPHVPPTPPSHHSHHHHQQQQFPRQDSYHPHQRPDQHQHPQYSVPSQHASASQHPSGYSSSHGGSHNHSLSHRQHDLHRQSVSHSQRRTSTHLPPSSGREMTYPLTSSKGSETEDNIMDIDPGARNGPTVSDGEYESEDEMNRRYQRRPGGSAVFIPTKPSPIFALPPFSALSPPHRDDLLEQMRQEIAALRRTSAEAVSTSIRLSEQLANANLEVSRSREAVRDLEDMLQDEAAKRKEAEKLRGIEVERRRATEDALSGTVRSPTRVRTAT